MSTVTNVDNGPSNGTRHPAVDNEPRTYRGTNLDELLPKIREELGPDAIVLRQRDGLDGGIGGFFQKRCVEVVARPAAPRVNRYDEEPAEPFAADEPEPPAPAIQEILRVAAPFADQLEAAQVATEPVPPALVVAVVEPEPEQSSRAAATHRDALNAAGLRPLLAAEIVRTTVSHAVPFAPRRPLKHLVRATLAARIPVAALAVPGGRAIAVVGAGGSGKSLAATRLATAYEAASDLDTRLLDLSDGPVSELGGGGRGVTIVDTPAVSPAAAVEVRALARQLRRLGTCEVHIAVPATLSGGAVRRLLDGLAPLQPAAIVLTHLDEVDHAGPVLDEAIARGLAISFCSDTDALVPADPAALAARVLP
ncbi:MAG TPA: hypothetical protein VMY78_05690 [Solirubrobacteraceae bacterium]|nr:hypothetical protein [Solirubrobacteraceae bacterium]